ncbi:MAG: hypothetical protein HY541_00520 [Deltaproteobacteria bacterium]|nr:hypothetical protein [Deltaproteobacteria bacterium]
MKNLILKGIVGLVVVVVGTSCGGNTDSLMSADIGSGTDEEFTGESLEGGAVSEVEIDGSTGEAVLDFGEIPDSRRYVLSIYHYSESGSADAFALGSVNEEGIDFRGLKLAGLLSDESEDMTEDFHEWLRHEEEYLDEEARLNNPNLSGLRAAKGSIDPAVGSTKSFKVLNSFGGAGSTSTVTAVLRYKTSNFLLYVDERNVDSLSDSDLEELAIPFDALIPEERALFGEESDINGDGRFSILLTQEVNELGGSSGGIITGFFYAVDLFSSSTYPQSNEQEVYYTFVPDPDGAFGSPISKSFTLSNILPGVLPHEFQHMINFNMHYFVNDGAAEAAWLNEGLAHLAEDIYSMNDAGYMEKTGIENSARMAGYLRDIDNICFSCGASLYQRGGSYLFMRYLYEQAEKGNLSGAASSAGLIGRLLDTDATGVQNVVQAALGEDVPTGPGFRRGLMGPFGVAVFMSNTALSGGDSRLEFSGINLRAAADDNRGTVLDGPVVRSATSFPVTKTIARGSISYLGLKGEDIRRLGGKLKLEMGTGPNSGAYLIQTGL